MCRSAGAYFFSRLSIPYPRIKEPGCDHAGVRGGVSGEVESAVALFHAFGARLPRGKKAGVDSTHNTPEGASQDLFHAGWGRWAAWRLDHQFHFDTILLCGDPSEFQPLLEEYCSISQRDFTLRLSRPDKLSFSSARHATRWTPDGLEPAPAINLQTTLADRPGRLLPAPRCWPLSSHRRGLSTARLEQYLDESLSIDRDSVATWTATGVTTMCKSRDASSDALEDTAHALEAR